jgi:hypothetical protein
MNQKWNRYVAQETYEKWWLGKFVRFQGDDPGEEKLVTRIEVYGPPSFVYGGAKLYFSDGSEANIPRDPDAYRPRKKDLIVVDAE